MVQGVEFDEEKSRYARPPSVPGKPAFSEQDYSNINNEPKMVRWLMRHGYAKSPTIANVILLIVVVLIVAVSYFIVTFLT